MLTVSSLLAHEKIISQRRFVVSINPTSDDLVSLVQELETAKVYLRQAFQLAQDMQATPLMLDVFVSWGVVKGMVKFDFIDVEGMIIESLLNVMFIVEFENGHRVLAHVSGKMRKYYIKILPGDRVKLQIIPYDLTRGRITYRERT